MSRADVVVIGSGVAGLATAIELARAGCTVRIVTTGELGSGSTGWAQGGIAAAVGRGDDPEQHALDTLVAGAHHGDPTRIAALTEAAPERLAWLLAQGASFDRTEDGDLALGREGGHHRYRVAHAGGDATGAEVRRTLVAVARQLQTAGRLEIFERTTLHDLGAVQGQAMVIATGGAGGLWPSTTNPAEVTGVGLALALRAGATLTDIEFVQFHPTALAAGPEHRQRPLITEALRGAGAVLTDGDGDHVMDGVHPLKDLAPRDVVARRLHELDGPTYLDARALGRQLLTTEFPTVWAACQVVGIDPSTQPIPVGPAQHFLCGGIKVDADGATDVPGLYAVGEAAATGVHGANRLASNSLLEGLVFGQRLARRLVGETTQADFPAAKSGSTNEADLDNVRALMGRHVGVIRTAQRLSETVAKIGKIEGDQALIATAIASAALARDDSRGCHWRSDHPSADPRWDGSHVVIGIEDGELRTRVEHSASAMEMTA